MKNYRITDKYGQTAVVLGHTPEHAAERCLKMYGLRAARAEKVEERCEGHTGCKCSGCRELLKRMN
jgi:hypothetical protein